MASNALQETAAVRRPVEQIVASDTTDAETPGFSLQTVGGVFDSAFDLYKSHFTTLALIVACVFIPTQVILHAAGNLWLKPLMAGMNQAEMDPFAALQVAALAAITGAPQYGVPGYLSLMTSFMASGPVAVAVASILVGRPVSVGSAYRRAGPVMGRLFGIWNLLFVLFFVVAIAVLMALWLVTALVVYILVSLHLVTGALSAFETGLVFVILMIVLPYIAGCALSSVLFAFAPPIVGLENLTIMGAVERNSRLVSRKYFWRVCLTVTMLPIVTFGLQALILLSAGSVVEALHWPAWALFVVGTGLSSLISFFFQPYWMIFITLLYFDLRVRQEGLDVRYLADNLPELDPLLGPPAPPAASHAGPVTVASAPPPILPVQQAVGQPPGRESL